MPTNILFFSIFFKTAQLIWSEHKTKNFRNISS